MKLKNKETGKVLAVESISSVVPTLIADKKTIQLTGTDTETGYREMYRYKSLAELAEEWEDYEEPKGWCVTMYGGISRITKDDEALIPDLKEIGNYFNDKESAYDALAKLKAWKRLKDKGFRFDNCKIEMSKIVVPEITITAFVDTEEPETLNLVNMLFGGEE